MANEIKTTINTVSITGELVKNGLEIKKLGQQDEYIAGSLVLRTEDGSEHEVNYYSNKYKKDENKNFTNEESSLYKGYETIISEYIGMNDLQDGQKPIVISVGACSFTDNIFVGRDGNVVESNKISAKFANRIDDDKLETTPKTATFQVSGVIKEIKDEVVKNVPNGNKLVYLDTIGYGGTITPIKLTVLKDIAEDFMKAGFYPTGTGKFAGKLVNSVEEYLEEQAFGEPIKRTRTVKRYEVTGGSPLGTLENLGITQEQYEAGKSKRRLKIEQKKSQNEGQIIQEGFSSTNNQQATTTSFTNPFAQA